MKNIIRTAYIALLAGSIALTSCDSDNTSSMELDGDTRVEAITVSGFDGDIDHSAKTIQVFLPTTTELSDLKVDAITLSEGATCDMPAGTHFDATVPQAIRVQNGNLRAAYTLTAAHDNVEFLSFTVDGKYNGSIDNAARTITVFVPMDANVSAMQVAFTATEGATVTPSNGSMIDFSAPVVFTAALRTASVEYTATVIRDDMSQEPKAFIGNASSVAGLGDEAAAACRWMMDNVPGTTYVSLQEILDGTAKLDDYKMIWAHLDFTDWPGTMWDTRDHFNSYWLRGGSILATRDGARYINDVWRIARDQQSPNDMFGGESTSTLSDALGFNITGHENHPLFAGLPTDADGRIVLLPAGWLTTGRTLRWMVDREPYGTMEQWEERTGARALASDNTFDANCVTIAEFEPYEALKGFTTGTVITIGSPAYEWNNAAGIENPYRKDIETLTKNAINYLCR